MRKPIASKLAWMLGLGALVIAFSVPANAEEARFTFRVIDAPVESFEIQWAHPVAFGVAGLQPSGAVTHALTMTQPLHEQSGELLLESARAQTASECLLTLIDDATGMETATYELTECVITSVETVSTPDGRSAHRVLVEFASVAITEGL